jgi:hypothetical protein
MLLQLEEDVHHHHHDLETKLSRFHHGIVEIITETTTTTLESHVMEKITLESHVTGKITPRARREEIASEADVIKRMTGKITPESHVMEKITPESHVTGRITQKFHVARAITMADHLAKEKDQPVDQKDAAKEALTVIMMVKLRIIPVNLTAKVTRIVRRDRVTERTTQKNPVMVDHVVEKDIQVVEEDPEEDLMMMMMMTTPENLTEERITRRDLIIQGNHATLRRMMAMIGDQRAAATRVRGEGKRQKAVDETKVCNTAAEEMLRKS